MTVLERCERCGHSTTMHRSYPATKSSAPCRVRTCWCEGVVQYCRHLNTSGLRPDDSVYCYDCGWTFVADG